MELLFPVGLADLLGVLVHFHKPLQASIQERQAIFELKSVPTQGQELLRILCYHIYLVVLNLYLVQLGDNEVAIITLEIMTEHSNLMESILVV